MQILIIDDVIEDLLFLETLLGELEASIFTVQDGTAGLKIAAQHPIHLILLDINMPGIDGFEVCKQLKKAPATQHIPVIFFSANNTHEHLRKAFAVGAADFIAKPASDTEIISRVKYHLQNVQLLDQLSEAKYRELTESLKDVVWKIDLNLNIIYLNQAFTDLFGYELNTGKLPDLSLLLPPDEIKKLKHILQKQQQIVEENPALNNPIVIELRGQHKNGQHITLETSATFVCNQQEQIVAIQGVMRDISERKKNQKKLEGYRGNLERLVKKRSHELENKNEQLQLIFDSTPTIMLLINADGEVIKMNRAACQFAQVEEKDVLNQRYGIALKCANTKNAPNKCIRTPFCRQCNLRKIIFDTLVKKFSHHKIASRFEVSLNGSTSERIFNISSNIASHHPETLVLLTIDDITEQQKALQALQESEQKFRHLVENINEVFWIFDFKHRKVLYISPHYSKITGKQAETLLNDYTSILTNVHPSDKNKVIEAMQKVMRGHNVIVEYRITTPNGQLKWLMHRTFFEQAPEGKRQFVYGVFSDISEIKRTEHKILEAILETENREREAFSKELHDGLGANLSAMKMYLNQLLSADLKPNKRELYLQQILELTEKTTIAAKEIAHRIKPHVLTNIGLTASLEMLAESINKIGNMRLLFKHNLQQPVSDKEIELAFYRISNELVNNSLKYSAAANATLELKTEDAKLLLTYSDDGVGFDPQTALKSNGSGLKNIKARVEALKGNFALQSNYGEGMQVKITIIQN